MRQDKTDALRQRLRQGARRFEFDALLQGVSTLDDAAETEQQVTEVADSVQTPASTDILPAVQPADVHDRDRLKAALDTLSSRLLEEAGKLKAAVQMYDAQEAGYYLVRVNQILELLHSVDPGGETARRYGLALAPPTGRTWPTACWTLYELAESPLSGLLPAEADEEFAREIVLAAVSAPEG